MLYKDVLELNVTPVPEDVVADDPLATMVPLDPRDPIETVLLANRLEGLVTWVIPAKAGRTLPATATIAATSGLLR